GRRGRARLTPRGIPSPRLSPMHGTFPGLRYTVSAVPARYQASVLPRRDVATADPPQETFGVPRLLLHGRIVQDTPEPGQVAHSAESPKARRQDLRPAASLLLSPLRCMQTEPRAASKFRGLPVCCSLAVGRRFAEEAPGEPLVPYRSVLPLLRTMPSPPDNP